MNLPITDISEEPYSDRIGSDNTSAVLNATVYPPDYKMQPYEEELSIREIKTMFPGSTIVSASPMVVEGIKEKDLPKLKRLTYAKRAVVGDREFYIDQYLLESDTADRDQKNTRYSTHGIHRYKGKFNPQISSHLLNIIGADSGTRVLETFCGSGTTVLECAHHGIAATGVDINPLAVLITNTKLQSLSIDTADARMAFDRMMRSFEKPNTDDSPRSDFLRKWLPPETFDAAEYIKEYTEQLDSPVKELIRLTASNQFINYSNQRPFASAMQVRKTPLPKAPYMKAVEKEFDRTLKRIDYYQHLGMPTETENRALCGDITELSEDIGTFDCALGSPPYTTAIPYIGRLRISLVWLDLAEPDGINRLESSLIGSINEKGIDFEHLSTETDEMLERLPDTVSALISEISGALRPEDDIRKQMIPHYISRYFDSMRRMFISVHKLVEGEGKFKLVVGANEVKIRRYIYIDAPKLLSNVAAECGWDLEGLPILQTFPKQGKGPNAIDLERIIELKRSG
jgi:site-specific DNA-methyltransferase (cytosine-N4-specific)